MTYILLWHNMECGSHSSPEAEAFFFPFPSSIEQDSKGSFSQNLKEA